MSDEAGYKWWLRYVLIPLVGGGGIVALIVALISGTIRAPSVSNLPSDPQAGSTRAGLSSNSPPVVFLSDLDETIRQRPNGGVGKDRPYWTPVIILNGKTYQKGLVTHAPEGGEAIIDYVVPRGVRTFRAVLGLADPCPDSAGSVRFRVEVNGNGVYASEVIRFGQQVDLPPVPVAEGAILTLRVSDAGDGNRCDQATWADARFVP